MAIPKALVRQVEHFLIRRGFAPDRKLSFVRSNGEWCDSVALDPLHHTPKAFTVLIGLSAPAVDSLLQEIDEVPILLTSRYLGSTRPGALDHQTIYDYGSCSVDEVVADLMADIDAVGLVWLDAHRSLADVIASVRIEIGNGPSPNPALLAASGILLARDGRQLEAAGTIDQVEALIHGDHSDLARVLHRLMPQLREACN